MKYFADFLKITLFVLLMYLPVSLFLFKQDVDDINKNRLTKKRQNIEEIQQQTQTLISNNQLSEACQKLDTHYAAGKITSFTLLNLNQTCFKPAGMNFLPPMSVNGSGQMFVIKKIDLMFFRYKTNETEWALSFDHSHYMNMWTVLGEEKDVQKSAAKELLSVIYIIFLFTLCAVLILSKSIQNKYKQNGKDPFWLNILNKVFGFIQLHDLKIISQATTALIDKNIELTQDIDLLETSLEFSILNEIKKYNHIVPYIFPGTVAKVDINGFSKVVSAGYSDVVSEMTTHLEIFGCELLLRYDGLFEKTIGDEIVVVFKGKNSELRAVAFARDLMHEYSQIIFNIGSETRTFTLKSAVYTSEITFHKRPSGYGFTGDGLTYTSRLMDSIILKDRNALSLVSEQANQFIQLIQLPASPVQFNFKNMSEQSGYHIDTFLTLEHKLENAVQNPESIFFFKADSHIIQMLQLIQSKPSENVLLNLLQALSKIQTRRVHNEIPTLWLNILKSIQSLNLTAIQLSQLLSLSLNLIPKDQWNAELTQALLKIPRQLEGRINATIIDILIFCDQTALNNIDQTTFIIPNDPSGRTEANLIVLNALQNLVNEHFIQIHLMIKSSLVNRSKSGIYAGCQLIEFYQIKNPAYLETLSDYHTVYDLLKKIKSSEKIKFSDRLQTRLDLI